MSSRTDTDAAHLAFSEKYPSVLHTLEYTPKTSDLDPYLLAYANLLDLQNSPAAEWFIHTSEEDHPTIRMNCLEDVSEFVFSPFMITIFDSVRPKFEDVLPEALQGEESSPEDKLDWLLSKNWTGALLVVLIGSGSEERVPCALAQVGDNTLVLSGTKDDDNATLLSKHALSTFFDGAQQVR